MPADAKPTLLIRHLYPFVSGRLRHTCETLALSFILPYIQHPLSFVLAAWGALVLKLSLGGFC